VLHKYSAWRWPTWAETCCFNKHQNFVVLTVIIYVVIIWSHNGMSTLKMFSFSGFPIKTLYAFLPSQEVPHSPLPSHSPWFGHPNTCIHQYEIIFMNYYELSLIYFSPRDEIHQYTDTCVVFYHLSVNMCWYGKSFLWRMTFRRWNQAEAHSLIRVLRSCAPKVRHYL
jgi:hypothetical protein